MRRIIAFALVGGLALTACGNDSSSPKSLDAKRTAASSSTSTTSTPFVAATEHTPGSLRNLEGARADVHDTTCGQRGDAWKAAGEVTNPTRGRVRYRVYVSFLLGDETVGITEANVGPIAAGATADWDATLDVPTDGLRCILRVERADA